MAPGQDSAALDDDTDALTDDTTAGLGDAQDVGEQDEFAAYAAAGCVDDVDKVRELIPENTKVTLGLLKAQLATHSTNTKVAVGKEYIYFDYEVNAPVMYADGSRKFGIYGRLSARASDPQRPNSTAFNVTKSQILRMAAAIKQLPVTDPAIQQFLAPALAEAAAAGGSPSERRMTFFVALEALINEELVGKSFDTDIGVDAERKWQGKTFREAQSLGRPHYPGRKERKSAKAS